MDIIKIKIFIPIMFLQSLGQMYHSTAQVSQIHHLKAELAQFGKDFLWEIFR